MLPAPSTNRNGTGHQRAPCRSLGPFPCAFGVSQRCFQNVQAHHSLWLRLPKRLIKTYQWCFFGVATVKKKLQRRLANHPSVVAAISPGWAFRHAAGASRTPRRDAQSGRRAQAAQTTGGLYSLISNRSTEHYITVKISQLVGVPPEVVILMCPVFAPVGAVASTSVSEITVKLVAFHLHQRTPS